VSNSDDETARHIRMMTRAQDRAAWRLASIGAKCVVAGMLALIVMFGGAAVGSVSVFWFGAASATIAFILFSMLLLWVIFAALWKLLAYR
jgi:hypothetical protein